MKQFKFLFLTVAFVLFFCACGGSSDNETDNDIRPDSDEPGPTGSDDGFEPGDFDDTEPADSDEIGQDDSDPFEPDEEPANEQQTGGI
ncbi:hypothetical protein J5834_04230, partial [bacterium]|nr:hypothetical protein [bacterium]